MRTREWREAQSRRKAIQIAAGGYWARGYHQSPKVGRVYFMSSWEELRWSDLDNDPEVVTYRVQPCRIPYQWGGITRNYVPDVLITYSDGTEVLEEIKPRRKVEAAADTSKLAAKLRAGAAFAESNGWQWRLFSYE